jgi:tyrosyl-tRNA synthetase
MISDFIHVAKERGFFYQATDIEAFQAELKKGPVTGYLGFDPTAKSLHVGNLVGIMLLRLFQQTGNVPIVLMGGGTAYIGDPSGRDETRTLMTPDIIKENIACIQTSFKSFVDFNDNKAHMVNNADWLLELNYVNFLRDFGRHFSVNRMLGFDSIKSRLEREQALNFIEFNYPLFQAYDFCKLYKDFGCMVQMGGSDQWGNIVSGVDLVRRVEGKDVFGWTVPLLTTSSGAKMGKTAKGAVWLNSDMLSPYDYWQFWRNTDDADVGRYLKLFTDLHLDEIKKLELLQGQEINDAKIILANAVTALLHGDHVIDGIHAQVKAFFNEGGSIDAIILNEQSPLDILNLLTHSGLNDMALKSRGEAKRLIEGQGVRINDEIIHSINHSIEPSNIPFKLSMGKKRHAMIQFYA